MLIVGIEEPYVRVVDASAWALAPVTVTVACSGPGIGGSGESARVTLALPRFATIGDASAGRGAATAKVLSSSAQKKRRCAFIDEPACSSCTSDADRQRQAPSRPR